MHYKLKGSRHVGLLGSPRAGARASALPPRRPARSLAVHRRNAATIGAAGARICAHSLRRHGLCASVHSASVPPDASTPRRRRLLRASLRDGPPRATGACELKLSSTMAWTYRGEVRVEAGGQLMSDRVLRVREFLDARRGPTAGGRSPSRRRRRLAKPLALSYMRTATRV